MAESGRAPCLWRGAYSLRDGHFIGRYATLRKVGVPFFKVSPAHDDSFLSTLAEIASAIGKLSPYSGGSVGGVLGGVSDVI